MMLMIICNRVSAHIERFFSLFINSPAIFQWINGSTTKTLDNERWSTKQHPVSLRKETTGEKEAKQMR